MTTTHQRRSHFKTVDAIMRRGLETVFPAAVLLITHRGETVFHRAYGWLDPNTRRLPTQKDTLFDLASLTKLFTATAFMTLVAKGTVTVDTPVAQVLPEFNGIRRILPPTDPHTGATRPANPKLAGLTVDAGKITFRQLLTHTSGLDAWQDLCERENNTCAATTPHNVRADIRRRRLNTFLQHPKFVYPPGKAFLYSDLGFITLGETIERLSIMPLSEFLSQAVLKPLALKSVVFNPLAHNIPLDTIAPTEFCRWRKRRIHGEVHDENAACLGGEAGHAGLFATAADVASFGQFFLADKHSNTRAILSDDLRQEMTREQVYLNGERRGLGWKLQTKTGSPAGKSFGFRSYGHTGFTGTSLWIDPERDMLVVLLTNRVYRGRDNQSIADFRVSLHQSVATAIDSASENSL